MMSSELSGAAARGARRRAKTRTAILGASEELLASTAPESLRIEDVAARAGVAPASVYLHFGTKDDLVAATIERLLSLAMNDLDAAYHIDGTPFDQVAAAGTAYLQLLVEHPAMTRYVVQRSIRTTNTELEARVDAQVEVLRSAFEDRIRAAIDAGLATTVDARLMSYFLFGAWNGVAAFALDGGGARLSKEDVTAAVLQAMEVFRRGATR